MRKNNKIIFLIIIIMAAALAGFLVYQNSRNPIMVMDKTEISGKKCAPDSSCTGNPKLCMEQNKNLACN